MFDIYSNITYKASFPFFDKKKMKENHKINQQFICVLKIDKQIMMNIISKDINTFKHFQKLAIQKLRFN